MRGLLVGTNTDSIFDGGKVWEIRALPTHIRGTIGLIQRGSGKVVGLCEIVNCIGPLSLAEMRRNADKHRLPLKYMRCRKNMNKPYYV